jgi:hypothetical protein
MLQQKAKWSKKVMKDDIQCIQNGKSIRSVSMKKGISLTALRERVKGGKAKSPRPVRNSVFTREQEIEIADHGKKLVNMFYGLPPIDLRRSEFKFVKRNKIKHMFSKESSVAGRDWLQAFLRRNPYVAVRKPEATSMSRIKGFNKSEVSRFFTSVEEVLSSYKFSPLDIYNMDETGMGTVQEPGRILAPKVQKRVGSVTSWERRKI